MRSFRIGLACLAIAAPAEAACEQEPAKPPVLASKDLEEDKGYWGVYCEGDPEWSFGNAHEPALDGKVLRCSLTGGPAYSNAHFFRDLPVVPAASKFEMAMSFYYRPVSTFNDANGPSVVQALEFTMNKWHRGHRYEWALQWQNVGSGGPQWCYWDPHAPKEWVPLGIKGQLAGEQWHTLTIKGRIRKNKVFYESFTINGELHILDLTIEPHAMPNYHDRLAIAVQLDGNSRQTPYDVFLDKVEFDY